MSRRLLLHVGMPKCATTTVQAFLKAESAALAERGVQYRFHPSAVEKHQGNGARLAMRMLHNQSAWRSLLDFHLSAPGDVLLSAEMFFPLFDAPVSYEVAEAIRARGFETTVIVYLRRQDDWVESDFKQQVKDGRHFAEPIDSWIERRRLHKVLNYTHTLRGFSRFFGTEAIRPVLLLRGQPKTFAIEAMLREIGIHDFPRDRIASTLPANVSPPAGLIEPARRIKARLIEAGTHRNPPAMKAALQEFFAEAPEIVEVPARRYVMPHARRAAIEKGSRRHNERLRHFFGVEEIFDHDVPFDEASEAPIDPEAQAVLDQWFAVRGLPTGERYVDTEELDAMRKENGGVVRRTLRRLRGD